jgi:hypothetical protein
MRLLLLICMIPVLLAACASPATAQATPIQDRLAAVAWIVGDWTGAGEGQPGRSTSERHAARIQNDHFIQVSGRSIYLPQPGNPDGETHTQIDFWSFDRQRGLLVLRQFDRLGFASTYVQDLAASTGGRIVLVSERLENVPAGMRARYTYEHPSANEYRELFELDMARGRGFETYVSNRFVRVSPDAR